LFVWLAQNLRDDDLWICQESGKSLAELPRDFRPYALTARRRKLDDPDLPISRWYFAVARSLQRQADGSVEEANRIDTASYLAILDSLPGKNPKTRTAIAEMLNTNGWMKLTPAQKAS